MFIGKLIAGTPEAKKWCKDFMDSYLRFQKRRVSLDELSKYARKLTKKESKMNKEEKLIADFLAEYETNKAKNSPIVQTVDMIFRIKEREKKDD